MGFWAGIKYALNSTLGTENFKPLDKIFFDGKLLEISSNDEDVLATITSENSKISPDGVDGGFVRQLLTTQKFLYDGTITFRLTGSHHCTYYKYSVQIGLAVYDESDSQVSKTLGTTVTSTDTSGAAPFVGYVNVPVKAGQTLSFYVYTEGGGSTSSTGSTSVDINVTTQYILGRVIDKICVRE